MPIYAEHPGGAQPWEIVCPTYCPPLLAAAKATPGMSWSQPKRRWIGTVDAVELCLERCRDEYHLDVKLPWVKNAPWISKPYGGDPRIREYQWTGIEFIRQHAETGCLLADEMGTGKSVSSILAAKELGAKKVLVVCPNAVKLHWVSDLKKWRGGDVTSFLLEKASQRRIRSAATGKATTVAAFRAGTEALAQTHGIGEVFFIINYDILHTWLAAGDLPGVDLIIFDEIHYLQSSSSRRSKAARDISAGCRYRVGLTGTPLTNRPRDLWNVVDTLTPGRFGNFFLFAKRYCGAFQEQVTPEKLVWNFEGKSNTEELNRRLQHFMLRRTVEEVKMQLPQKTRQIIELDVSKKYRMSYGANDLRDTRLVRQMLDVAADGKIDEALNLVMDHARAGHHVVAFSHRRVIAETIASTAAAQGLKAEIVYGGVPNQRRKERIDSRPDILACTIDSCSTGIDLTSFDVAVVIELVYKPHELVQMEARLHRFGQQRPVLIQYIIAQGTIDELIAGSVIAKIDTFKEVIGKVGGAGELSRDLDSRGKNDPLANLVKAFEASRKGKGK